LFIVKLSFEKKITMAETNLSMLIKNMQPVLNEGDYVFCSIDKKASLNMDDVLCIFKEKESTTVVLKKETANTLGLKYIFTAAWITLNVFSSLEAAGLTAVFSTALAEKGISCNVIAAYHHDHIFVNKNDAERAVMVLKELAANS
jgi:uncharacterized protein